MFVKSLLAIVLTAAVAGSVVFYGSQGLTDPKSAEVEIANPIKPDEVKTKLRPQSDPAPIVEKESEPIEPPKPDPEAALEEARIEAEKALETLRTNEALAKESALETVGVLLAQTSQISEPSMQDQAHLNIVIYALRYGLVNDAKLAMGKINQIELRETARSRIAIALAQNGDVEEAFALVDAVEIEDLRDVMRLQVIESITQPDFARLAPRPEPMAEPASQ